MNNFIKNILKFSIGIIGPLLFLILIYISWDPFKVIKSYDSFFDAEAPARVGLNKDYVSTMNFIKNFKINYNSFIFGNSRSIFYEIKDWKKHLKSGAKAYHFDASGESLWAIDKKIKFIDKQGKKMENILLILDYSTIIQDQPKKGHLNIVSPPLVGYSNLFEFHKTFFFAFLDPKFLYTYTDYKLSGQFKEYMNNDHLLDDRPVDYDFLTNEFRFSYYENLIKKNMFYTKERKRVFYERENRQQYYPMAIFKEQKSLFSSIKKILKEHNSNVKVIISPLYDQKKINKEDLEYLNRMFGNDNVFDFSGVNSFTKDYTNYYENSHYRPHVARKILELVYAK